MASRRQPMKSKVYTRAPAKANAREEYVTKKQVKMLLTKNLELKSYDNGGVATISNVAIVSHQSAIPQGNAQSQRVGNEIVASYAEISYMLTIGDALNWVRIIYFQWHEDNAISVPTIADLLYTLGGTNPGMNLLHFDERHRFKVIYDKVHRLEATSTGSTLFVKDLRVKIPHKTIAYNGTATTGQNQIYVAVVSDSALGPHPTFNNQFRLLYRDA